MILQYSITVFITQLVFIGCRTWNVQAVAKNNITQAIVSGLFVNMAWLVSTAIGAVSTYQLINDFSLQYIPVVICSMAGGAFGSYIAMVKKNDNRSGLPKYQNPPQPPRG